MRNKLRSGDGVGHLLGNLHPLEFGARLIELGNRDNKMFGDSILLNTFVRGISSEAQLSLVSFVDYPNQQKVLQEICDELIRHEAECSNARCHISVAVDAAIAVTVALPWEMARYSESDTRDFESIRENIPKWKNLKAIS